jgi:translation initiation factor IF-1
MKSIKYAALLSMLAVLCSVSALARDKNQHSVEITGSVQVAGKQLEPGNYKVEWQGTGPEVQVAFVRHGKTVATVPGTLKTSDARVTQDDIVIVTTSANTKALTEIDFSHNKESLGFEQSGM